MKDLGLDAPRTWHYALSREQTDDGEYFFEVREVYLDDQGELSTWSKDPVRAGGETWNEAVDDLARYTSAMGRLVLDLTVDPPVLRHPREVK